MFNTTVKGMLKAAGAFVLCALLGVVGCGVSWADCESERTACTATAYNDRYECLGDANGASAVSACQATYRNTMNACTAAYNACSASQGVIGYINPKFIVLGVTYAPPGGSSYVSYAASTSVGTTNTITTTASDSKTISVSSIRGVSLGGYFGGAVKTTNSTTETETSTDGKSVTLNWGTGNTVQTYGVPVVPYQGVFTSSVDHDYDIVYVWLNPVMVFNATDSSITWNGYGYDANDQNGMDIIGIYLGYLNGDFGAMPAQITNLTNRAWAAGQTYAAGQSAALNSGDFAVIASVDPFNNSNYGYNYIGSAPPTPSTADGRFTLSACNSGNSVSFTQAAPLQSPSVVSCTLSYSNTSASSQSVKVANSVTYSIDIALSTSFLAKWQSSFGYSYTLATSTEVVNSVSSTTSSSSVAYIEGLACGASSSTGPCVPAYTGPTQFNIYQDNMYGTFMFAPVHFY